MGFIGYIVSTTYQSYSFMAVVKIKQVIFSSLCNAFILQLPDIILAFCSTS